MKMSAIAFLLWCSCAPLTSPEGGVPGDWQGTPEETVATPSALEAYMAARLRYGEGPRPDFIAVVPFADESGFREGVWNVEYEMANMLSIDLAAIPEWQVVPFNAVAELTMAADGREGWSPLEVGRHLLADMVVLGLLQDYDMRRLSVGDPLLGGYKSYVAVAQIRTEVVRVADGGEVGIAETLHEVNERDLGLNFLGKPREMDKEFAGLAEIEFGSDAFRETLLGGATLAAMDDQVQKIASMLKPGGIEIQDVSPEIISVYGDDIYANLGSEHGLRPRFRFGVYPNADRAEAEGLDPKQALAVVEVAEVIGARLSSLRVLGETGAIMPGDRLKLVEIGGE